MSNIDQASNNPGSSSSCKRKSSKSAAGRLPAKCLSDFFPRHRFKLVSVCKRGGRLNGRSEYIVQLILPSVNDAEFTGRGWLEKLAKHEAAAAALKHFNVPGCDKMIKYTVASDSQGELPLDSVSDVVGYVMKLFGPSVKFTEPVLVSRNKTPLWRAALLVQSFTFVETGPSKRKAKEAVAVTCIKTLKNKEVNINLPVMKIVTFEDNLMDLMYKILRENTNLIPKSFLRFRNVAGIYIHNTADSEVRQSCMIVVAAGGNTVDREKLTFNGTVVHDCNAEILAIRAFRLFLFDQLWKAKSGESTELCIEAHQSGQFHLKDNFQVIMVKNNPPSGDALVFESLPKKASVKHLLNVQQGTPGSLQFPLTIIKSGQPQGIRFVVGAYFETNKSASKPMFACPADKLTLCNIVGVQGSLLSEFVEPIFITKYVFHQTAAVCHKALERSFYKRIECHLRHISPPYKVNKPHIVTSSSKVPFDKMYGRYAGWVGNQENGSWEVIKLPDGLALGAIPKHPVRNVTESDTEYYERKLAVAREIESSLRPSQLCKLKMFEKYKLVCETVGNESSSSYSSCKANAVQYQAAKLSVKRAFTEANLGAWPAKITDTNHFSSC